METETTASARQREATYPDEKKQRDTDLEFFPGSNMLVSWVTSSLRLPLKSTPKIDAGKLSSPYIFVASVQLSFLPYHVSLPAVKKTCHPLPSVCRVGSRNISVSGCSTPAQKVSNLRFFFLSFLITTSASVYYVTKLQRCISFDVFLEPHLRDQFSL